MNVSLQDEHNIGWKLAHIIRGKLRADAIGTYVSERSKVAAELIDFDRKLTNLYNPTDARSAAGLLAWIPITTSNCFFYWQVIRTISRFIETSPRFISQSTRNTRWRVRVELQALGISFDPSQTSTKSSSMMKASRAVMVMPMNHI
jgi:hypothetical protein